MLGLRGTFLACTSTENLWTILCLLEIKELVVETERSRQSMISSFFFGSVSVPTRSRICKNFQQILYVGVRREYDTDRPYAWMFSIVDIYLPYYLLILSFHSNGKRLKILKCNIINYLTWLINLNCIQSPKSRKGKGKSVTWTWCCLGHRNPRIKFIFKTCLFSPTLS